MNFFVKSNKKVFDFPQTEEKYYRGFFQIKNIVLSTIFFQKNAYCDIKTRFIFISKTIRNSFIFQDRSIFSKKFSISWPTTIAEKKHIRF